MDSGRVRYWLQHWTARYFLYPAMLLYALFTLFALCFSDAMLFPISNGHASYADNEDIIKLTTVDGARISARYLPNPAATYTILYSHGNGEDLGQISTYLEALRQNGFAVFAYDYHGYGTSQGTATEANTYRDIDAAYAYVTGTLQVPANRILIFGRSLGGGPSVDLAARRPAAALILESTFATAYSTMTHVPLLPFDKYRSIRKIRLIHCPILVIHGRADLTIPFDQGQQLFRAANAPKSYLWVNGGGHNNLPEVAGARYLDAIKEFADKLPK